MSRTGFEDSEMLLRAIAALALVLIISGCSKFERVEIASRARAQMGGMSKAEVLVCMGAPARKETEGEIEVWTYPSGGDAVTVYNSGVASTINRYCMVTLVFRNGFVQSVNYSGRTGGLATKGEQCAFAVENCVR